MSSPLDVAAPPAMKTQQVKERPLIAKGHEVRAMLAGTKTQLRILAPVFEGKDLDKLLARYPNQHGCPLGEVGERLWVRETAAYLSYTTTYGKPRWVYRADANEGEAFAVKFTGGWKPSIFMPRAASRLLLEIVSVRVERVQTISEADAVAEGYPANEGWDSARLWYQELWEKINGPGSWAENPWVWVVQFKKSAAPLPY